MAEVLGCFHAHVNQDLVQRHVPPLLWPPRHLPRRVQRQRFNGGVAVFSREPVEFNDLLPCFLGSGPHVGIGLCVLSIPRQVPRAGPPKNLAEVSEFHAGHVLDQAKEVGTRRRHRPPGVVLVQSVELREEIRAPGTQVAMKNRLIVHSGTIPTLSHSLHDFHACPLTSCEKMANAPSLGRLFGDVQPWLNGVMIRKADRGDLSRMQAIEVSAGKPFRRLGMAAVADDPPLSSDALAAYTDAGRAWVATDNFDYPAAYILVSEVDGWAHIAQVSVHARHARERLGQALIEEVGRWATASGLQGITLTTFAYVPWNGPYYARLGFVPVPEDRWSPGLREIVAAEAALGLGAWPRVVMKRRLSGVE